MDKVYGSEKRIFLWMEKSVAPTVSGRWWWDKTFNYSSYLWPFFVCK